MNRARLPGAIMGHTAPSTRTHLATRAPIRPDIHERFLRILAKVDAEIAARATPERLGDHRWNP